MGKLTVVGARNATPGRHADGLGLYLLVKPTLAKSWLLRVQVAGQRRDIGLGGFTDLTLAEAREEAARLRKVARAGGDPVLERDKDRRPVPPFRKASDECHAELSKGWTDKHAAAFLATLKEHAFPALGNIRVDHIEASTIRDALAPIWIEKPVMARKVRQRISTVLNFSKSKGWRATEAPTSSVSVGLSRQPKGKSFAAMPYVDVPAFFGDASTKVGTTGRLALLFTITTAARSGEVRSARWSHIDLAMKVWRRPAELMKSREAHDVTLNRSHLPDVRTQQYHEPGAHLISDFLIWVAVRLIAVKGFRYESQVFFQPRYWRCFKEVADSSRRNDGLKSCADCRGYVFTPSEIDAAFALPALQKVLLLCHS